MEQEVIEHKNISEALVAIYKEVGYVQKQGKMAFGNTKYTYAGEADLISAIRPVMVKHGVTLSICDTELVYSTPGHVIVKCFYQLKHGASITAMEIAAMGEGKDSGDKAIPKALTGAYKYALRQTFMIETGDDPDQFASDKVNEDIKRREAKEGCQDFEKQLKNCETAEDVDKLWKEYGNEIQFYKNGGKVEVEYFDKLKTDAKTKKAELKSKPEKQVWEDENDDRAPDLRHEEV